jgi:hypothetical protein
LDQEISEFLQCLCFAPYFTQWVKAEIGKNWGLLTDITAYFPTAEQLTAESRFIWKRPKTPHPVLLPQSRVGEIATQSRHIRERIWQGRRDVVASASYPSPLAGEGRGEGGLRGDSVRAECARGRSIGLGLAFAKPVLNGDERAEADNRGYDQVKAGGEAASRLRDQPCGHERREAAKNGYG